VSNIRTRTLEINHGTGVFCFEVLSHSLLRIYTGNHDVSALMDML
jgi:hypothetical protein